MEPFLFIIPNKKLKVYFVMALGIVVLNLIGGALMVLVRTTADLTANGIFWAGSVALLTAVFFLLPPKRRLGFAGTLILLLGIFWMSRGYSEIFFANLILWLLYSVSRRTLLIRVDAQAVTYPSFPKKEIPWAQLNQVILKDDILTIDLKNNKVYQHLIEYADNPVKEKEFNEFCSAQLADQQ